MSKGSDDADLLMRECRSKIYSVVIMSEHSDIKLGTRRTAAISIQMSVYLYTDALFPERTHHIKQVKGPGGFVILWTFHV